MTEIASMASHSATKAAAASEARSSGSPQRTAAPRKRIRNFTADDRAAHRVFEKSRREAFKHRLIELAGLLPTMVEVDNRRLSKHVVVDESINRHRLQQKRCESAAHAVRALFDERDSLLGEVNRWRSETGTAPAMPMVTASAFSGIMAAEQETYKEKLGNTAPTPPSIKAERAGGGVAGGMMMMDEDGYMSAESHTGSVDDMMVMRTAAAAAAAAGGMPVLDPSLRGLDRVDMAGAGGGLSDKDMMARRHHQNVAHQQRPHPDMNMHRATMFGSFDMSGGQGQAAPPPGPSGQPQGPHQPPLSPPHSHPPQSSHQPQVPPPQVHQAPPPHHQHQQPPSHQHAHHQQGSQQTSTQQQQQQHPHHHQSQAPPRLPGMAGEYMAPGMRVDPRHGGGVSPAQQQQQLAAPGAYDPVTAAAHGHASHASHGGHGPSMAAVPPQQHGGHSAPHGGHGGHGGHDGQHPLAMPTTQAQYISHHMGAMPYMSNMGWQ